MKPMMTLSFVIFLIGAAPTLEAAAQQDKASESFDANNFTALKFRCIGPYRGGRSNAVHGVIDDPQTYYFGSTGGGLWKTNDAGLSWQNISDGFFKTGSVGAIAVAPSDANVIYVGMGEHAVRGVMTSHGDGVYKSTDAGKTWKHVGLPQSMHIAAIRVHPENPDHVWVAVQGALYGPSKDRGVYLSEDGGANWQQVLFINETTGAADLSLDANNPRILYAGMWDHRRFPWKIRSGGPGSSIHKSVDGGKTWQKLTQGLPEKMGKVAVDVSPANSNVVYANIEAKKGGVFRSDDAGNSWKQVNSERVTVARAWYYIEIFADPKDEDQVYVLNAPMLKSIDGGVTFESVSNPHTDQHDMWINPKNTENMILANDGGACVSFNGGGTWSTQFNQPTAQFYRVITDNQFPYRVYAGQQDNSTVSIANRTRDGGIGERDWFPTAGGESAFLAFDPDDPRFVYGTSVSGIIERHDTKTEARKSIMAWPQLNLGTAPENQKYRFNWNGPLVAQIQNPEILYHGGQLLLRSDDRGHRWTEISPDLTRDEKAKHGEGGGPFTNEAAGGEVYNTISYIACSPHRAGEIWVGTDDGLVHRTDNEGKSWQDVTPDALGQALINAIDLSPHDPATAFIAVTRYKFGDLQPMAFVTQDGGQSWKAIDKGIAKDHFVRVVRQDPVNAEILYAGTEGGLYISFNQGGQWHRFQSNLPVCPITDLTFQDNDLIVATSGSAFWIMDDLSALQQSGGAPDTEQLTLFQPHPAYKFATGGPPGDSAALGASPPPGVPLDYYLPHDWSGKDELTLQVLDEAGKVLRTVSNDKPDSVKTWPGGPPTPQVLPAKPGLNRFTWDLRRDPLPAVHKLFVFGSHAGYRAIPGKYTARLSSGDREAETAITVKPDPRIKAPDTHYQLQRKLLRQAYNAVEDIHRTVEQFRQVETQLKARLKLVKNLPGAEKLVELADETQEKIDDWERLVVQSKQKTFQDVVNFPTRLNGQIVNILMQVDTNEPRPTQGAQDRLDDLLKTWQQRKRELQSIQEGPIKAFNDLYRKKEFPALIVPDK